MNAETRLVFVVTFGLIFVLILSVLYLPKIQAKIKVDETPCKIKCGSASMHFESATYSGIYGNKQIPYAICKCYLDMPAR